MNKRNLLCGLAFVCLLFPACGGSSSVGVSNTARLLITEDFNNCNFSPGWNGSMVHNEYYTGGEQPFVQMEGHGCVLQQYIPRGVDDTTPAQVGMYGGEAFKLVTGSPDVDEFYVEWQEFFPEDHDFADAAQKMLRFKYQKDGEAPGAEFNLMALYNNTDLQLSWYYQGEVDAFRDTRLSVPVGRWTTLGVWCKLNTPGERDGFVRLYIDQELATNVENINFRANDRRGWNLMWVGGNHTNHGPTTRTSRRFIDNIKWWSSKP